MSNVLKCITIYSMILSVDIGVLEMIVLHFGMHEDDIIEDTTCVCTYSQLVDHYVDLIMLLITLMPRYL